MSAARKIKVLDDSLTGFSIVPKSDALPLGLSRTMVILVHGYNNDRSDASEGYAELRSSLRQLKIRDEIMAHLWDLYWPGYLPKGKNYYWRRSLGGLPSKATYPFQVHRARWIGRKLARYFERIPSQPRLIFVGHSLGCRVVLEIVRQLDAMNSDQVVAFCLMAAAVPAAMLNEGTPTHIAVEKIDRRYVLYSELDMVLKHWFTPGEWAAAPVSFPTAVGRSGEPEKLWNNGYEARVHTWLDHGDYFRGGREFFFGRSATAPYVARLLGQATPWEIGTHKANHVNWDLASHDGAPAWAPITNRQVGQ